MSLKALIKELEDSIEKGDLSEDMKAIRSDELSVARSKLRAIMENPNVTVDVAAQRRAQINAHRTHESPSPASGSVLASISPASASSTPFFSSSQTTSPITFSPPSSPPELDSKKRALLAPIIDESLPQPSSILGQPPEKRQSLSPPFSSSSSSATTSTTPVRVDFEQWTRQNATPLQLPLTSILAVPEKELQSYRSAAQSYRLVFTSVPLAPTT